MTSAPLFPALTSLLGMRSAPDPTVTPRPVRMLLVMGGIGPDPAVLTRELELGGEVLVVGATFDPLEGIELAGLLQPDVVVVDQLLGLASGTAVARHVLGDAERAEIVLRTPWPDADRHDAERAGVFATVDIAAPPARIAATITAAAQAGRRLGGPAAAARRHRRPSLAGPQRRRT